MGAAFVSFTVKAPSDPVKATPILKKAFSDKKDNDAWDFGHGGYTGSFAEIPNITVTSKIFNTSHDADEYVADNAQKWEDALAVRFKNVEPSKSIRNHIEAIRKLDVKIREANQKVHTAEEKARINNRTSPPNYLLKARENREKVLARTTPLIEERRTKIADIEAKLAAKSNKVVWFIGGWASD